jgi:SAM-dependent methyltransferase
MTSTTPDPYSRVDYRRFIAWPKRIQREWPLLSRMLDTAPTKSALDLGCGPGEHVRALASKGYQSIGVDRSEDMIQSGRETELPDNARLLVGDLTRLDTLGIEPVGAAICLGNTLPHLTTVEDLALFLDSLARLLLPQAPFLLQILNYDRIFEKQERYLPLNIRDTDEGEAIFLRLMRLEEDGRVFFYPSTLLFRPHEEPHLEVKRSKRVALRGWRSRELEEAFEAAGLSVEARYGAYDETPFVPLESRDLLLLSRRRP